MSKVNPILIKEVNDRVYRWGPWSTTKSPRRTLTKAMQRELDYRKRKAKAQVKGRATKSAETKAKIDAIKNDIKNANKVRTSGNSTSSNATSNKQSGSTAPQNNVSANNSNNPSSNQANAKTNTGNQTTANQPQTNNVSNNTKQPSNNTKSTPNTGSKPVTQKPIWSQVLNKGARMGIPIIAEKSLDALNSTSPTNNKLLPYDTLTENTKKQGGTKGTLLNIADMFLNPMDSYYWKVGGDWAGDGWYDIGSNVAGLFSDDKAFTHNVGATARDVAKDAVDWGAKVVDIGGYLWRPAAIAKGTYVPSKAAANNIWDVPRDFEDIKDYSYKNLGFDDYIGDSIWLRGTKAGFNNLFSRFGENRDFYQRGRYSLNEMLSTMAKDIENHKDKNSTEYKDLVDKFERFNNLAKFSDFYWTTKKEMDASDLSKEDFLKSKNLTPEAFDAFEQNAYTLHNLGSNLDLNESNGNKRSDYVEGNYSYPDYTDAVNTAKKGLEGDNTDIDTDTLNAAMNMGTDVAKVITGKPVNNTTSTGTNTGINNAVNENTQSSITPDYLTEFYKKFDKTYNYDPAKGRFNIWL